MSGIVFHVINQTHWDREWHMPFERFRLALVEVIDRLLDDLDNNSSLKYFMLDGQTIVLEDYLEIRPENENRLKDLIKAGKITVGPWYLLADMFLPSGESLVRNLLLGKEISEKMGGRNNCGYLPDVFGFNSQIPQILKGFDIDNAQIFRGVGTEIKGTEFIWKSPDGSNIMATYLPGGYYNFNLDVPDDEGNLQKARNAIDMMQKRSTTNHVLLMSGMDHYYADNKIQYKLDTISNHIQKGEFSQSTIKDYIRAVKKEIQQKKIELQIYSGEFRTNRPARITPGVLSTRIYLKQENALTQNLLERYTEPFSVFNWFMGGKYDRGAIKQAWKYLLQNHPHDSICGCSVDEVHTEMMNRFSKSKQISHGLIKNSLTNIVSKINTSSKDGIPIIVFNTLHFKRNDIVKCKVYLPFPDDFDIINSEGNNIPFHIVNKKQVTLKYVYQRERWGIGTDMAYNEGTVILNSDIIGPDELKDSYSLDITANTKQYYETDIEFIPKNIPQLGWETYYIVRGAHKESNTSIKSGNNYIENEFYKIEVSENGSLSLYDKNTKTEFHNINYFIDSSDAGDEYNYSPAENDQIFKSSDFNIESKIESHQPVKACLTLKYYMELPATLSEDRKSRSRRIDKYPIDTKVTVYSGERKISFETTINNTIKDHRLRVAFDTPIRTEYSYALNPFDCIKRRVFTSEESSIKNKNVKLETGEELEVSSFPQSGFVDVFDDKVGLSLIADGLPEYEVIRSSEGKGVSLQLTLLRSVGWLSRSDFISRNGHAGPMLATPEAQCIGKHKFSYALVPNKGMYDESDIINEAISNNNELKAVQTYPHRGQFPAVNSLFKLNGEGIVLSALKIGEIKDSVIIRLFNINNNKTDAVIFSQYPIKKANLLNLQEDIISNIGIDNGYINIEFKKKQIITIEIEFDNLVTEIN